MHDDREMHRRFTQSMDYTDENRKTTEHLEKSENITDSHTNYNFDLQLLNRRSKRSLKNGYAGNTPVYPKKLKD